MKRDDCNLMRQWGQLAPQGPAVASSYDPLRGGLVDGPKALVVRSDVETLIPTRVTRAARRPVFRLASEARAWIRNAARDVDHLTHTAQSWLRGVSQGAPPQQQGMKRALVVGAGAGGQLIADELRSHPKWQLWPVGFVDDDSRKQGHMVDNIPVLGGVSSLPGVVERERIDVVIIAIPSATMAKANDITATAHSTGAEVLTMPAIGSILRGEEKTTTLRRVRPVDVLGRPVVEADYERCFEFIHDRRVLITGAAGSIGQELARQVLDLQPSALILVDINESDLFDRTQELLMRVPNCPIHPYILSVTDKDRIDALFHETRPDIVFHAAAYKHVPLMEAQPGEAVRTNIAGTRIMADAAARHGVKRFVLVSTDKAVRPSSVMGASKRVAEMVVFDVSNVTGMSTCAVRFGNVLGSRGSVIPTFERQIQAGGPVTVTDPRMRRFFMTIPEASGLIIQAGAFGESNVISILDMGTDVSIVELAERVIELHGLRPHIDIPIIFTGMREGEKLREDLANDFETARKSPHQKIRLLDSRMGQNDHLVLAERLADLEGLAECGKAEQIRVALHALVQWGDARGHRGTTAPAQSENGVARAERQW